MLSGGEFGGQEHELAEGSDTIEITSGSMVWVYSNSASPIEGEAVFVEVHKV